MSNSWSVKIKELPKINPLNSDSRNVHKRQGVGKSLWGIEQEPLMTKELLSQGGDIEFY